MKKLIAICAVATMILAIGGVAQATTYEALFTSADSVGAAGFAPPSNYNLIYPAGNSSLSNGGLDQITNFGLRSSPVYTGWNADHTGIGHYDDPVRGWSFNNSDNNGGYTDAYSTTETTDSGYVEFEWTFDNVVSSAYSLIVTVDDLDDYVTRKGITWATVPDEWKVYVNGSYIGTLYAYDDTGHPETDPVLSINTFDIGNVGGSVKIEINGTYFNLLHDDAYYGLSYGKYASWGDTASAQHGIRLEGLELIPEPATICILGIGALSLIRRKK
jgi:hypothetical protein